MRIILLLILAGLSFHETMAQENRINASFYQVPFYSAENGSFVETYLSIFGHSVLYSEIATDQFQASIEILYVIEKDQQIVDFKKLVLKSPTIQNDSSILPNFMDVQRFWLDEGSYQLVIRMVDLAAATDSSRLVYPFEIVKPPLGFSSSGTQWVEEFKKTDQESILSKHGYDLIPYVSDYFPQNTAELIFYKELYFKADSYPSQNQVLLKYYIEKFETKTALTAYNQFRKIDVKPMHVIFSKFNIANLPSGNYNLVIEMRNADNQEIYSNRSFFQRSNPGTAFALSDIEALPAESTFAAKILNPDTLKFYLDALYPIAATNEQQYILNLIRTDELTKMQQFFYYFWHNRNNILPEKAWLEYKERIDRVNQSYSTQIRKGYQTDRGRVYLMYGEPNIAVKEKYLPDTLPFEIWQYYELEGFRDRKFLFYNPHRQWNSYELLHSNMIQEIKNENWLLQLRDYYNPLGNTESLKYDLRTIQNSDYGLRVLRLWENP